MAAMAARRAATELMLVPDTWARPQAWGKELATAACGLQGGSERGTLTLLRQREPYTQRMQFNPLVNDNAAWWWRVLLSFVGASIGWGLLSLCKRGAIAAAAAKPDAKQTEADVQESKRINDLLMELRSLEAELADVEREFGVEDGDSDEDDDEEGEGEGEGGSKGSETAAARSRAPAARPVPSRYDSDDEDGLDADAPAARRSKAE